MNQHPTTRQDYRAIATRLMCGAAKAIAETTPEDRDALRASATTRAEALLQETRPKA